MSDWVSIRIDIFERAFKTYRKRAGGSFESLARDMRVPVDRLREWRRTGEIPVARLASLAAALGVDPERLARIPEAGLDRAAAYLPNRVGHNLLSVARTFRSYTRFIGRHRIHPGMAHHRAAHHDGESTGYATLFLATEEVEQEWLFSVWFGLRMDYGWVRLHADGTVELDPILQEQPPETRNGFSSVDDDGMRIVPVQTWFGRPQCDFIVHAQRPFDMRVVLEPLAVPGAVTFVKNPFQRDE